MDKEFLDFLKDKAKIENRECLIPFEVFKPSIVDYDISEVSYGNTVELFENGNKFHESLFYKKHNKPKDVKPKYQIRTMMVSEGVFNKEENKVIHQRKTAKIKDLVIFGNMQSFYNDQRGYTSKEKFIGFWLNLGNQGLIKGTNTFEVGIQCFFETRYFRQCWEAIGRLYGIQPAKSMSNEYEVVTFEEQVETVKKYYNQAILENLKG